MDWLRSRWEWVVRNGFLTCVIVFAVGLLTFGVVMVYCHWGWIATESGSTIIRNLGLVVGGLIAIVFGIWRGVVADRQAKASLRQAETSHHGLLNERYQKGAEMLGSEVLSVRMGGIYALQRLAEDQPEQYHVQIMRLLCAFVRNRNMSEDRNNNAEPEDETVNYPKVVQKDIQAAMLAIGARSNADIELEKKEQFELDLVGAHLSHAHLVSANLVGANLSGSVLYYTCLVSANLTDANLTGAFLFRADLSNTVLSGVNLAAARRLTQEQLDQACADSDTPPKLGGLWDAANSAPLKWQGKAAEES